MSIKAGKLVCESYEELGIPALYLYDLTGTTDARRLLHKTPPVHPASSDVLPNLVRWNPDVAYLFSDKNNFTEQIPFRLVTKSPAWMSTEITSFVAVSYCWHSEEWDVPDRLRRTPNGWSMPVFPAMLKALLRTVEPHEAIWIDQLCIEQSNIEEKQLAIANMDTVYLNCVRVSILLEDLDVSHSRSKILLPLRLAERVLDATSNLIFALPAALNHPESVTSHRLWVLRRLKGPNRIFSIVGQGYFLGGSVEPDDEDVEYLKNITVFRDKAADT